MKSETKYGMIFNIQKFSLNDGPGIRGTRKNACIAILAL